MDAILFLSLTIVGLIFLFQILLILLHKKHTKMVIDLRSENANLKDEIERLETFQDEILDMEEKIFDEWLMSQVKSQRNSPSQD